MKKMTFATLPEISKNDTWNRPEVLEPSFRFKEKVAHPDTSLRRVEYSFILCETERGEQNLPFILN